jgi:uncharacterized protein YndB with AHSA1/START domain
MHILIISVIMVVAAIAALAVLVLLIGMFLPEEHLAEMVGYLDAPPEKVWDLITNFEAQPTWRTNLQRVERLPDRHGNEVWREVEGKNRQLSYETIQFTPPHLLVRRIVDEGLPFGGSWTFEITPEGRGAQLRIIERGEVHNLLFRFVSKFIIGHTATMRQYFNNLQRALKVQSVAA